MVEGSVVPCELSVDSPLKLHGTLSKVLFNQAFRDTSLHALDAGSIVVDKLTKSSSSWNLHLLGRNIRT